MAETLKAMLNDQKLVTTLSDKFFSDADTDGSGLIELRELHSLLHGFTYNAGLSDLKEEDIIRLIDSVDQNGDRKLNKIEFRNFFNNFIEAIITMMEQSR